MSGLGAIVMAAGKGTRMKSDLAKVLHPIGDHPLLRWAVQPAVNVGATPVVIVVGHQAEAVEEAARRSFPAVDLGFSLQAEQLGTGHAVLMGLNNAAFAELSDDFKVFILSGDVPGLRAETLSHIAELGQECELVVVGMRPEDPTGYGRVVTDDAGSVERIVEHKDASEQEREIRDCNAGIYLASLGLLRRTLSDLSSDNAQGEYYLPDIVPAAQGRVPLLMAGAEEVEGINDRDQLAEAQARLCPEHQS